MTGIMAGYTPAAFAPMGATYQNWLQNQMGSAPLAQAYGSTFAPYAQLAYQTNPVSGAFTAENPWAPQAGANPFQSFLGSGASGFSPSAVDWVQRAQNVQSALGAPLMASGTDPDAVGYVPGATEAQLRIQERFGTGEQAADRQRQLAQAPIVSEMPFALRGETQNILNRLYNQWLVNQPATVGTELPQGYLDRAMGDQGLWSRFGVS